MKTSESHFEKPDFLGKLIGYTLIIVSVIMLVYSERGTRGLTKSSEYMMNNYVELTDTTTVLPENDGKMVYYSAYENTFERIADPVYGIGGQYLAIARVVEYYQWIETATTKKYKRKNYDTNREETEEVTEYSYAKGWSREPVDSKKFDDSYGHENETPLIIKAGTTKVSTVKMGAYFLGEKIKENAVGRMDETLEHGIDMATARKPLAKASAPMDVHLLSKEIYYGENPERPQIGDVRVSFLVARPRNMYVLAKVEDDYLEPCRVAELGEDIFKLAPEPIDTGYYLKYDTEGAGYLMLVLRIIAWLLIVWAVHELKGSIVESFRKKRFIAPLVPKADNKLTLWAVGTYLAIFVIICCHILSWMTS